MRQLFLPPNKSYGRLITGTFTNYNTNSVGTVTLPDGIWTDAIVMLGGNNASSAPQGVMVQCSTDKTKTQSFQLATGASASWSYAAFYSKIAGATVLCDAVSIWNAQLLDVWIDGTTRPNTLSISWQTGKTLTYCCYTIEVFR